MFRNKDYVHLLIINLISMVTYSTSNVCVFKGYVLLKLMTYSSVIILPLQLKYRNTAHPTFS